MQPAGLQKDANKEYIIKRCFDATLKTSGRNITTEVLANAQLVSAKFAQMYLCTDGLPIDKSSPCSKATKTMRGEWMNRDLRMQYTLMRPAIHSGMPPRKTHALTGATAKPKSHVRSTKTSRLTGVSGYFPQKWATERNLGADARNASYDWPVLRYAEVLLNYAEAVYRARR